MGLLESKKEEKTNRKRINIESKEKKERTDGIWDRKNCAQI